GRLLVGEELVPQGAETSTSTPSRIASALLWRWMKSGSSNRGEGQTSVSEIQDTSGGENRRVNALGRRAYAETDQNPPRPWRESTRGASYGIAGRAARPVSWLLRPA